MPAGASGVTSAYDGGVTRREMMSRAVAIGTLAAAGALAHAAEAEAAVKTEAQLLLPILGAELVAVFSYQAILQSSLMTPHAERVAQRMLGQEHAHVKTVTNALHTLGGTAPQPLHTTADADAVLAAYHIPNRLSQLRTERDCLTILVRVENVLARLYYTAMSQLGNPQLIQMGAQVMASEAQHASILNLLLRPHDIDLAVPSSYVR
jgi:hypothetical protein